jgi:hypothetical protein
MSVDPDREDREVHGMVAGAVTVGSATQGSFSVAMSTSFQPAEWALLRR